MITPDRPCRTPRPKPGAGEGVDSGGHGVLPGPPRRRTRARRGNRRLGSSRGRRPEPTPPSPRGRRVKTRSTWRTASDASPAGGPPAGSIPVDPTCRHEVHASSTAARDVATVMSRIEAADPEHVSLSSRPTGSTLPAGRHERQRPAGRFHRDPTGPFEPDNGRSMQAPSTELQALNYVRRARISARFRTSNRARCRYRMLVRSRPPTRPPPVGERCRAANCPNRQSVRRSSRESYPNGPALVSSPRLQDRLRAKVWSRILSGGRRVLPRMFARRSCTHCVLRHRFRH